LGQYIQTGWGAEKGGVEEDMGKGGMRDGEGEGGFAQEMLKMFINNRKS